MRGDKVVDLLFEQGLRFQEIRGQTQRIDADHFAVPRKRVPRSIGELDDEMKLEPLPFDQVAGIIQNPEVMLVHIVNRIGMLIDPNKSVERKDAGLPPAFRRFMDQ